MSVGNCARNGIIAALFAREGYEAALAELIERWGEQWPSEVAHVYAWAGDADAAFLWLEKEVEKSGITGSERLLPYYTLIRADSRWAALLDRAGVSPAQLDAIEFRVTRTAR